MAIEKIPTLLHINITKVNPDVCDVHQGFARVRFPNGGGQFLNSSYKDNPENLQDLLFRWLSAHIDAVRNEAGEKAVDNSLSQRRDCCGQNQSSESESSEGKGVGAAP